jgi:hypothetical protein
MNSTAKSPRNPWPIAIIVWLALFLVFTAGLVTYISRQKVDLVRGDYYDQEIRYQEQLDRMNRTQPITNQVAIIYDAARGAISIKLPPAQSQHPTEGRIRLYRPSDENLDQDVKLSLTSAGSQDVDATKLRAGLWKVRVYWTVDGQDYYFGQSVVIGPKKS